MNKLRIGLLLDSMHVDKYVLDLLNWARHQDNLELATVIVRRAPASTPRSAAALASGLGLRAVMGVERPLLRAFKAHRSHLASWDLPAAAPDIPSLVVHLRRSGDSYEVLADDLPRVAQLGLD